MATHDLSRRQLLRLGLVGAAGLAGARVLAACGGDADPAGGSGGTPGRGGVVRVGALGGAGDDLDLRTSGGYADYLTILNVWDSLAVLKGDGIELSLAEEIESNPEATAWTVRLRQDVTFHDGKPLVAADVVYSLRLLSGPTSNFAALAADVDLRGLRAVDRRTVEIPVRRPRADLLEGVLGLMSVVYPDGLTDFSRGAGTGPFRLVDYRQGEGARLEANPDHWAGPPLLDGVEVRVIAEPSARLDALRGGEIDYALGITPAGAASVEGDGSVSVRRGGPANSNAYMFCCNRGLAPFDDPDVRRALRLAVDRQALVDVVLHGQGTVGNDVVGLGLPGYADDLAQHEPDLDEARSLFRRAGVDRLTIRAADIGPGLVDAADLLVQQVADAGVDLTVEQAPADSYFADMGVVMATPFQAFYFVNRPPASHIPTALGRHAGFNITGHRDPAFDALVDDMQATVNADTRADKLAELQRMLHEDSGEVVWGFAEQLDATVPGLDGVELTQSVPLFLSAGFAG
jgi:peptide/nickel transport system substrate-binding protein